MSGEPLAAAGYRDQVLLGPTALTLSILWFALLASLACYLMAELDFVSPHTVVVSRR